LSGLRSVKSALLNQLVAATIIRALGYYPSELNAVRAEEIDVLPFLFTDGDNDDK
jgi:hypothetical protein